jgi:hypothetical protein
MKVSDLYLKSDIKTTGANEARVKKAIDRYGLDTVASTLSSVALCDADIAHTAFQDMGMEENADCVTFLFFNEDDDDVLTFVPVPDFGPNGPTGHGDTCYSDADDCF